MLSSEHKTLFICIKKEINISIGYICFIFIFPNWSSSFLLYFLVYFYSFAWFWYYGNFISLFFILSWNIKNSIYFEQYTYRKSLYHKLFHFHILGGTNKLLNRLLPYTYRLFTYNIWLWNINTLSLIFIVFCFFVKISQAYNIYILTYQMNSKFIFLFFNVFFLCILSFTHTLSLSLSLSHSYSFCVLYCCKNW